MLQRAPPYVQVAQTGPAPVETSYTVDVCCLAQKIKASALVLHAREDVVGPFEQGRQLSAVIPTAQCIPLDSKSRFFLGTARA